MLPTNATRQVVPQTRVGAKEKPPMSDCSTQDGSTIDTPSLSHINNEGDVHGQQCTSPDLPTTPTPTVGNTKTKPSDTPPRPSAAHTQNTRPQQPSASTLNDIEKLACDICDVMSGGLGDPSYSHRRTATHSTRSGQTH